MCFFLRKSRYTSIEGPRERDTMWVTLDFKINNVSKSKKSPVWSTFGIVSDSNGVEQEFVACKSCNHVLQYKKNTSGTSTMRNHKCTILAKGQPMLLTAAVKHQPPLFAASKPLSQAPLWQHLSTSVLRTYALATLWLVEALKMQWLLIIKVAFK